MNKPTMLPAIMLGLLLQGTCLPAHSDATDDPTRPASLSHRPAQTGAAVRSDWTLNSILVAPDRRVAVINGNQVSEGDQLNGARVERINNLTVELTVNGRRKTLQLLPDIVNYKP